jgi:protein-S-isoprenylcysteine O-methyltransferase Ste14
MEINLVLRIITLVVLVLTFSISAFFRKTARETGDFIDRREEGSLVLFLRMAFGLPLLATLLLNIFYPRVLTWSKVELPLSIRLIGVLMSVLCVPLLLRVFQSIGRNISETVLTKRDHELVTSGPYRWVRHPLYSSALLLLFSLSIIFGDWVIFIYSFVGMIVFRYLVIPTEEEKLIAVFGEDYEKYQNRTGALIPKLR